MEIISAIDIGTNSVRLLVTKIEGNSLTPIYRDLSTTRIGEGLALTGFLKEEAIGRTVEAVSIFYKQAERLGAETIYVFATSAVRDATNKEEFIARVRAKIGCEPEIIAGELEARLSFLGASSLLTEEQKHELVVIDIGGGSTEVIFNKDGIDDGVSVPIGAVRLSDNPLSQHKLREIFIPVVQRIPYRHPKLLGVGGTLTSLAAIAQKLEPYDTSKVHGFTMSMQEIRALTVDLHSLTLEERKELPGLQPQRADIIPFGADILKTLLELFGADHITVSESDILEGRILHARGLS